MNVRRNPFTSYSAYFDSATGTGTSAFTLPIAHRLSEGTVLLDAVRERKPRFVVSEVIAEYGV